MTPRLLKIEILEDRIFDLANSVEATAASEPYGKRTGKLINRFTRKLSAYTRKKTSRKRHRSKQQK